MNTKETIANKESRNCFHKYNKSLQNLNKETSSNSIKSNKIKSYGLVYKNKNIVSESDGLNIFNDSASKRVANMKKSPKCVTQANFLVNSPKMKKMEYYTIRSTSKMGIKKPLIDILIKFMRMKVLSFYFRKYKMINRCLAFSIYKSKSKIKISNEKSRENNLAFFRVLKLQEIFLGSYMKKIRPCWRKWVLFIILMSTKISKY